MKSWHYLLGVFFLLVFGRFYGSASAESPLIQSNSASVQFPDRITFSLSLDSAESVQSATLTYDVEKFSCLEVATDVPIPLNGANELSWTWEMVRSGNPPTGVVVWWQWTIITKAGDTITTPRQSVQLDDRRFTWRKIERNQIDLYWYSGDDEVGKKLADSAESALNRLENEMGILFEGRVQLYIYGSTNEMRQSVLYIQDWAGGVAFSEYNTILIGVPPTSVDEWGVRTVAHEMSHLVLGQFGRSCLGGSRPTWLEEGIAQLAEGEPTDEMKRDLENGVKDDSFSPLRSLNGSFPAHDDNARSAYSQSYSTVHYLLEQYGSEKLNQLILGLKEGRDDDAVLQEVYGFNLDGLETAWRKSVGASPRPIKPTLTPISAESIPTIPPISSASDFPTPVNVPLTTPVSPKETTNSPLCGLGLFPLFFPLLWVRFKKR